MENNIGNFIAQKRKELGFTQDANEYRPKSEFDIIYCSGVLLVV